jgi:hypothetical protein
VVAQVALLEMAVLVVVAAVVLVVIEQLLAEANFH